MKSVKLPNNEFYFRLEDMIKNIFRKCFLEKLYHILCTLNSENLKYQVSGDLATRM
jgi:hypothetical protein